MSEENEEEQGSFDKELFWCSALNLGLIGVLWIGSFVFLWKHLALFWILKVVLGSFLLFPISYLVQHLISGAINTFVKFLVGGDET